MLSQLYQVYVYHGNIIPMKFQADLRMHYTPDNVDALCIDLSFSAYATKQKERCTSRVLQNIHHATSIHKNYVVDLAKFLGFHGTLFQTRYS